MEYKLNKTLENFVVHREHIEKIISLFEARFVKIPINIEMETKFRNGEAKESFSNFSELDRYVQKEVIALKREVTELIISCYYQSPKNSNDVKHALLSFKFKYSEGYFFISSKGNDEFKDWSDGFYSEMEGLLNNFLPEENIIKFIKEKEEEKFKYRTHIVFFDYNSRIEKEVLIKENENQSIQISGSQVHFGSGDNVSRDKNTNINNNPIPNKEWYEKPLGIILIALIIGGLLYLFGWN